MTKWKKYEKDLDAWEKEKIRQSEEFTCTEKDIDADLRLPQPPVRFFTALSEILVLNIVVQCIPNQ